MKQSKLQRTMDMFLYNPTTWYSNRDLNFGVNVNGETLILNYLTDNVKYLQRITLPSSNKLRIDKKRVKKDGKLITYYKMPELSANDYAFVIQSENIKTIKMVRSKSLFDRFKSFIR